MTRLPIALIVAMLGPVLWLIGCEMGPVPLPNFSPTTQPTTTRPETAARPGSASRPMVLTAGPVASAASTQPDRPLASVPPTAPGPGATQPESPVAIGPAETSFSRPLPHVTRTSPATQPEPGVAVAPPAATQPQPRLAQAAPVPAQPGQPGQLGQPGQPVVKPPAIPKRVDRPAIPGAEEIGGSAGPVTEPAERVGEPTVIDQAAAAGPADLKLLPGLPAGVKAEYTMPGKGAPPAGGDAQVRQRAAFQAALCTAIYNVTKELNEHSYTDPVERGYIDSDHFRYNDGLEVKSQTVVIEGRVRQFDIWLLVPGAEKPPAGTPPAEKSPADKIEVHVRNFTLMGPPLNQDQLDRLLRAAGGHLVVVAVQGPDDKGLYTAEVGLVRRVPK